MTLGLQYKGGTAGLAASNTEAGVGVSVNAYGKPIGSTSNWNKFEGSSGVTTDPDNSGIIIDLNDSKQISKTIIKY